MAVSKYDAGVARRPVKLIRSPQGDKRNIRIMRARGLKQDVSEWALEKIRSGEIAKPDAFIWSLTKNEKNLDDHYLQRKVANNRLRERLAERRSAVELNEFERRRVALAYEISEEEAFSALPDRIRDDEVMMPKTRRRTSRKLRA